MPVSNTTPAAESIGMALLRHAAAGEDAFNEDCCAMCHSADLKPDTAFGADWLCTNCGWTMDKWAVVRRSHLADALRCYNDRELKIEHHDLRAVIEHAAYLEMQVREMTETLRIERDRMRRAA